MKIRALSAAGVHPVWEPGLPGDQVHAVDALSGPAGFIGGLALLVGDGDPGFGCTTD